jgi:hypothetical protein
MAAQTPGGEDQPPVAQIGMRPGRRDQLAAMVRIHGLADPSHRVRGAQPLE